MSEKAKAMVLAAFVGDALALGAHWEYDVVALRQRFGPVTGYAAPGPDGYHGAKKAGEFTHYGDQTRILLRSLADKGGFDLDDFAAKWLARMRGYDGFIDGATRMTLKIFDFGEGPGESGSNSNDLAGAARIAPLVCALRNDLPALVAAARAQTKMTHNHAQVIEAAEFFARAARAVLDGKYLRDALAQAAEAGYASAPIERWLAAGLETAREDTVTAIGRFGQSCHIAEAFPAVITSSCATDAIWPNACAKTSWPAATAPPGACSPACSSAPPSGSRPFPRPGLPAWPTGNPSRPICAPFDRNRPMHFTATSFWGMH